METVKVIYMGRLVDTIVNIVICSSVISVVGAIADPSMDDYEKEKYETFWMHEDIKVYSIDDIESVDPDCILVPHYSKLIKSNLINKYKFINIHAGILPKWRGFNSNCWAILNGETKVGYTVHRIQDTMDGGEIYKVYDVEMGEDERYFEAKKRIMSKLCNDLEKLLQDIVYDRIIPQKQVGDVVYNCRIKESDGEIKDWNIKSQWLLNLMRIFDIRMGGTGVKLFYKNNRYIIVDMQRATGIMESKGIPGSVVNKNDKGGV